MFVTLATLTMVLVSVSAAAQDPQSDRTKWELDFHAGSLIHYAGRSSSTPLPPGVPYAAFVRPLLEPSLSVSSWYFGDGARLFNTAAERVGPAISKITPLDPVLTTSPTKPSGATFGFRLSRRIFRAASVEFSVEHGRELSLSDQTLAQVEASRSNFATAFGSIGSITTDSRSTIKEHGAAFTFSSGALVFNTRRFGRITPFVRLGAGLLSTGNETPNASLVGSYDPAPRVASNLSDVITDTVKLDFGPAKHQSFAALFAGGAKVALSNRWGIRLDFAAHIYRDPITTSLTAVHTAPQTVAFVVADDPRFVQFLAFIPIDTALGTPLPPGPVSSLSGPAISGFKTYTEKGLQSQLSISVGPYWRF